MASLEEEPSAGNGRERGPRLAPAAARAVQVEAGVHLENLAGPPSGAGDRPAVTAAANALAGGLRVQALEAHGLLAVGDPAGTDNTARVVRGLSAMVGQRGGVMTMRLAPPELGAVRVQMTIVQGSVTAQFTPTTEHAGALLRGHLGVLRTALEGHGLHVERLSVHVAATESSPGGARHDGDSPTSHDRDERHDAGEHESRGRRHGRHPDRRGTGGKPADFRGVIGRSGTGSEPRHQGANTT